LGDRVKEPLIFFRASPLLPFYPKLTIKVSDASRLSRYFKNLLLFLLFNFLFSYAKGIIIIKGLLKNCSHCSLFRGFKLFYRHGTPPTAHQLLTAAHSCSHISNSPGWHPERDFGSGSGSAPAAGHVWLGPAKFMNKTMVCVCIFKFMGILD